MHTEALHQLAFIKNNGAEGFWPQPDLRNAHTAEVFDHAGYADKFVKTVREDGVVYAAVFNVAERNAISLKLAADSKQTALAVGVTVAVGFKHIVLRPPQKNRKPQLLCDHSCNLLVAEVAVDDENRVSALLTHPINDRLHILFVVKNLYLIDPLEVNKRDVFAGEVFFNVRDSLSCTLLGVFPVENTGTRGAVSTDGHKADPDMIIEHGVFSFSFSDI